MLFVCQFSSSRGGVSTIRTRRDRVLRAKKIHACVSTDGAWARTCVFVLTARDRWHVDLTMSELRRLEKKFLPCWIFCGFWIVTKH